MIAAASTGVIFEPYADAAIDAAVGPHPESYISRFLINNLFTLKIPIGTTLPSFGSIVKNPVSSPLKDNI